MKKILIGFVIGVTLCSSYFIIMDLFTIETRIPKNHVTVRLQIKTNKIIDKILLTSTHSTQTIELCGQKETIIIFPNPDEGEFKICCQFQDGQELCSQESYVEAGYSLSMKIKDKEIETLDFY